MPTSLDDQSTICKSIKSARYTQRILCDGLIVTESIRESSNLTVLHTQTGYTLKPCTRRFQVVSWPNLTVLHTQTGYKRKPWHRYLTPPHITQPLRSPLLAPCDMVTSPSRSLLSSPKGDRNSEVPLYLQTISNQLCPPTGNNLKSRG